MPLILGVPEGYERSPNDGRSLIEVALLNNLSDAGLESGERQFMAALDRASGTMNVHLRLYSLPQIARGTKARARMEGLYGDISELLSSSVDGLIVTGCEPRADRLQDETFWPGLVGVIDWARRNTRSTIWSCLAAHAAVLHLDSVKRRRLPHKCSGVFSVEVTGSHPLITGARSRLTVPHSRYNDVSLDDLRANGYDVLTRANIGVDTFVKPFGSLFVFLQGHPEYDAIALRREYRRDMIRFLDKTAVDPPRLPANYFLPEAETHLRMLTAAARKSVDTDILRAGEWGGLRPWGQEFAQTLFRNWLRLLPRMEALRHANASLMSDAICDRATLAAGMTASRP